jgi:hypothetical protein
MAASKSKTCSTKQHSGSWSQRSNRNPLVRAWGYFEEPGYTCGQCQRFKGCRCIEPTWDSCAWFVPWAWVIMDEIT